MSEECFADNQLKEIDIPEGVEILGTGTFMNNLFKEIGIPDSLKEIRKNAFSGNLST